MSKVCANTGEETKGSDARRAVQKSAEAIVGGKEAVTVKTEAFMNTEGLNVSIRRRQRKPAIKAMNNRKHKCTACMRISRKLKV